MRSEDPFGCLPEVDTNVQRTLAVSGAPLNMAWPAGIGARLRYQTGGDKVETREKKLGQWISEEALVYGTKESGECCLSQVSIHERASERGISSVPQARRRPHESVLFHSA